MVMGAFRSRVTARESRKPTNAVLCDRNPQNWRAQDSDTQINPSAGIRAGYLLGQGNYGSAEPTQNPLAAAVLKDSVFTEMRVIGAPHL